MAKRILIIEDEPAIAKVLAKRFIVSGFEVRHAADATYGIQEAHQFKPDLILLDLMLPAGGGFFVLSALRESINLSLIPVIVLTGMAGEDYKKKVMELGVEAYLQKPYDPEHLIAEVKRALGEAESDTKEKSGAS